jgi:hypothetical protein
MPTRSQATTRRPEIARKAALEISCSVLEDTVKRWKVDEV